MTYPGKGKADYLELGSWNAVCYQCGRKFKASTMKRHWQGYWVCKDHWEPRQPQDFVRAKPDVQTPPWVQPMPADVFTSLHYTEYLNETVDITETQAYFTGKRLSDTVSSSEVFKIVRSYFANETLTFGENVAFSVNSVLSDNSIITEDYVVEWSVLPDELLTLSESDFVFFNKVFPTPSSVLVLGNVINSSPVNGSTGTTFDDTGYSDEDVDISEGLVFDATHTFSDTGTWTETFLVAKEVIYSDTFGPLSEVNSIFFDKQLPGVFLTAITGNVLNSSAVNATTGETVPAELIGVSENYEFLHNSVLADLGLFSESFISDFQSSQSETITGSETIYIDHATLSDIATLNETAIYSMNKVNAETIALTESLHSVWNPSRPLNRFRLNTYSLG